MKKRQFIKASTLVLAGNYLMPMMSCKSSSKQPARLNWAGNLAYQSDALDQPESVDEVQMLLRSHNKVKALGTRHSFNSIADTPHRHLSLDRLEDQIEINRVDQTVTVSGGVQYGVLAAKIHEAGFALHNLASLPHISIAGACATGTHGSGDSHGNLPSIVVGIEMYTAEGNRVRSSKNQDVGRFNGMIVNLGALGIVTKLTLSIRPTFDMVQFVYEDLPLASLQDHFEEIFSSAYSVSLFTDWQKERINQVWQKVRIQGMQIPRVASDFFGATLASDHLHPIKEISAENCTEQMGLPGPWHERLPHFKMDFTPSSGKELQSEFFVPRANAVEAIGALYRMGDEIFPHLLISEIRSIAADRLWLSPAYGRDSIAIHFTWKQDWPNVRKLLPKIENELKPFQVRPHWGKLFTLPADYLKDQYERMEDFKGLVQEFDPNGKFRNSFLEQYLSLG
jgi:xylitol oxidase